jgi:hypothetical protein
MEIVMMKNQLVQLAAHLRRTREITPHLPRLSRADRRALTAVWIETGNPRQPLACVWVDQDLRSFSGADENRGSTQLATGGDEDGVPLAHFRSRCLGHRRSRRSRSPEDRLHITVPRGACRERDAIDALRPIQLPFVQIAINRP